MLAATNVAKSYGEIRALEDANLSVSAGEVVALLGRNGAGKSTLISVIAGLIKPDAGEVRIGGLNRFDHPDEVAAMLGVAPQETGVYMVLTVRENLDFFAELARLGRSERGKRVTETAEQLGLGELMDRRGSQLSGGELRRLHTACALLHRPRLLMLDEPTVGADVETRALLIQAVKDLANNGAAVVYTTHYLPEVEALGANVVIIDKGAILASGTQDELVQAQALRGVRCELAIDLPAEPFADLEVQLVSPQGHEADESASKVKEYRLIGDIDIAGLLDRLGPHSAELRSVEALRPNLEEVFLTITGSHVT